MVVRRNALIVFSLTLGAILLTQFQNCAPAKMAGTDSASSVSGEARTIEDWNKAELEFYQANVQIHDEADVAGIDGLCNRSHNGASLKWSIWAGQKSNTPLFSGTSQCQSGKFSVNVEDLAEMVCGDSHLLVVEADWGVSTFTHVTRRCQPLASEQLDIPSGSPIGTECSLEYQPSADEEGPCVQICYRDNKVVANRVLPIQQCSALVAKLQAGI